ncbi:MAG: tRNA pseudouridine(55) synthase TruB, partial [Parachlamydiaceae bacterium]
MATGVMVMLIGKAYTRLSDHFLHHDKEYEAEITLGHATDSYDAEGTVTQTSSIIPSLEDIEKAILRFQGTQLQIPPMFSAKKVNGKKLYELARKGETIERKAVEVTMRINLISYCYPSLKIQVACSKGTYIRSLAHDIGLELNSFGTLTALKRIRSGKLTLEKSVDGKALFDAMTASEITPFLIDAIP